MCKPDECRVNRKSVEPEPCDDQGGSGSGTVMKSGKLQSELICQFGVCLIARCRSKVPREAQD